MKEQKKQKRYQYLVCWIQDGKVNKRYYTNHRYAETLYEEIVIRGIPAYFARKISDVLSSQMFDHVKSENGFGKAIAEISERQE